MTDDVTIISKHKFTPLEYLWIKKYSESEGFNSIEKWIEDKIKTFVKETKPLV